MLFEEILVDILEIFGISSLIHEALVKLTSEGLPKNYKNIQHFFLEHDKTVLSSNYKNFFTSTP